MPHADPEKRKAYAAEYRAKNREKARQTSADWRVHRASPDYQPFVKNPNAAREGQARYVAAHPERVRESSRACAAKARAARSPEKALEVSIYMTLYHMREQTARLEQRRLELYV